MPDQKDSSRKLFSSLIKQATINYVVGSPKTGRNKMLLSQLNSYQGGGAFFGYELAQGEAPLRTGMIAALGTDDEIKNVINDLQLTHLNAIRFPVREWDHDHTDFIDQLADLCDEMYPQTGKPIQMLIVRGLQNMMISGRVNDFKESSKFCHSLQKFLHDRSIRLIGIIGTAKQRASEQYSQIADKPYGAMAWADAAGAIISIERMEIHKPEETRPRKRRIVVQSSSDYEDVLEGQWDIETGQMMVYEPDVRIRDTPALASLSRAWEALTQGAEVSSEELRNLPVKAVGKSTVKRWLPDQIKMGFVERVGDGNSDCRYRKPFMTIN